MSLSAHWLGKIIPTLIVTEENMDITFYPPTLDEFNTLLNKYKELMPKELEKLSLLSIWENSIPKMQNVITQKLYEHEKVNFENIINNIDISTTGDTNSQIMDFHQMKARLFKIQHISNMDSHVSAWIHSNPADTEYKMNNPAWNLAMKSRLQLSLSKNTTLWCFCGKKMDHLCAHPYTCPNKSIYNSMRGPHHKKLKNVLHNLISQANSKYKVENIREPLIEDYFPRLQQNILENQSNNSSDSDNNENFPEKNKHRGDIILRNNVNGKYLIIDLKLTDPNAKFVKEHTRATQPANQGEAIKRQEYSKLYDIRPNETAQMIFLTLTTSGAPSKDTKKFINLLFEDEAAEYRKHKKQQFCERLSSSIQTMKSLNIQNTINHYTTIEKPNITPPYSEIPSHSFQRPFQALRLHNSQHSQISELTQNSNVHEYGTSQRQSRDYEQNNSHHQQSINSSSPISAITTHGSQIFVTVASSSGPVGTHYRGRQSIR
jgi:hypothetical protein